MHIKLLPEDTCNIIVFESWVIYSHFDVSFADCIIRNIELVPTAWHAAQTRDTQVCI